jgi:hypothetical protein
MPDRHDVEILKANPGLVEYLFEGRRCNRLTKYQSWARSVMDMYNEAESTTRYTSEPDEPEQQTAEMIKRRDGDDLGNMLITRQIPISDTLVCRIYARLVKGHENDRDCEQIVVELIRAGLPVPART